MRENRFFINANLNNTILKIVDFKICHQIRNVLRLRAGEKIILADGQRNEATARIIQLGKNFVEVEILTKGRNKNESKIETILYCSILKRENFELVVQKATEIGVKEIIPVICRRTIKLDLKKERLEKIIKEAAEQSGRGIVPVLRKPLSFSLAIKAALNNDLNIFFQVGATQKLTKLNFIKSDKGDFVNVGIFVGPEGGWDETELKLAKENNFIIAGLGSLTLRSETAAIIASYFVCHMLK